MQELIDEVQHLAGLQQNITEGPWAFETDEYDGAGIFVDEFGDGEKPNPCMMIAENIRQGESNGEADAEFICAARDFNFHALAAVLTSKPVLTEREQQAIDNINKVLDGDGSDPESGPGAWADCGEVDVPVLLALVARLTK